MRCRKCSYILDHLPEPRCPECGRAFDPADPYLDRDLVESGGTLLVHAMFALLMVNSPILLKALFTITSPGPAGTGFVSALPAFLIILTFTFWFVGMALAWKTSVEARRSLYDEPAAAEGILTTSAAMVLGSISLFCGLLYPIGIALVWPLN